MFDFFIRKICKKNSQKIVFINDKCSFQCQFQVDLEGQSFHSCVVADNKKTAQRKASLDMVIKLYRSNLIDGNRGDRFGIYASKVKTFEYKNLQIYTLLREG